MSLQHGLIKFLKTFVATASLFITFNFNLYSKSLLKKIFHGPVIDTSKVFEAFNDNFHKVSGLEIFRSEQLGYKKEKNYLQSKNIQLTINLRGHHPESGWYRDQARAAKDSGATFICANTSANSYPSMHALLIMLAVIKNPRGVIENQKDAQKNPTKYIFAPNASTTDSWGNIIKIKANCMAGVDRTGMFCALAVIERSPIERMNDRQAKEILKKAQAQLTLKYKHFKFMHYEMKDFIEDWWNLRKSKSLKHALEMYKPINIKIGLN
ncbi:hypothetical protein KAW80_01930 [Candidatus Babeliales bacterium]|nr:hypothetical protein [Candidatus Babeliales bacterium]